MGFGLPSLALVSLSELQTTRRIRDARSLLAQQLWSLASGCPPRSNPPPPVRSSPYSQSRWPSSFLRLFEFNYLGGSLFGIEEAHDFFETPHMIRNARFHRRRDAQAHRDFREI